MSIRRWCGPPCGAEARDVSLSACFEREILVAKRLAGPLSQFLGDRGARWQVSFACLQKGIVCVLHPSPLLRPPSPPTALPQKLGGRAGGERGLPRIPGHVLRGPRHKLRGFRTPRFAVIILNHGWSAGKPSWFLAVWWMVRTPNCLRRERCHCNTSKMRSFTLWMMILGS